MLKEAFRILADAYDAGLLTRLALDHPDLTKAEIGLCGMLTLGLEPPCIGKVMGYEHVQTFYNKRKNIRKKLHLPHDQMLESFLIDKVRQLREAGKPLTMTDWYI